VAFQQNTAAIDTGIGASRLASVPVVQKLHTDQGHAQLQVAKESCFGVGVTMNQRKNGAIGKMESGTISAWTTSAMAR
jgi:hypothetical protein